MSTLVWLKTSRCNACSKHTLAQTTWRGRKAPGGKGLGAAVAGIASYAPKAACPSCTKQQVEVWHGPGTVWLFHHQIIEYNICMHSKRQ